MGMENYSLSDIRAATDHEDDGWGGNGSWFWIVVLFLFMFGNGNVFGNRDQGALTRAEMTDGFNNQSVLRKLDGITNGLCDGFYAQNTGMLNGFNGVQRDLCTGFSTINSGIAENRFASQQCCCETNRNIDSVRYEASKNTCDITTAIHAEGEQTRALINANTMQALRDKLADRDRDLMTANFQLSQQAQNATLINELRPCARPAYITCSPYQVSNSFGCGNSCGCA